MDQGKVEVKVKQEKRNHDAVSYTDGDDDGVTIAEETTRRKRMRQTSSASSEVITIVDD